jgi:cobalt-precorrin-5B (C1)-methyltransferase
MSSKGLKSGYTTGTHATALVGAVLEYYFNQNIKDKILVKLPNEKEALIDVVFNSKDSFSSIKVDNDDLDVTKGAELNIFISKNRPKDLKPQIPSILNINSSKIYIYGGSGVGVVTKKGLKIAPNYPAINPTPLAMMESISKSIIKTENFKDLHIILSITDGQEIAKSTANSKVGVIGGLSILGTKGIVKPISAEAYIDSIEVELSVLDALGEEKIIFTLGNSSLDYAKKHYKAENIIEIGNFIYDSFALLDKRNFKRVIFIAGVAKMVKVAQGAKNTHNRFGGVDFDEVNIWLNRLNISTQQEITIKGVLENLTPKERDGFLQLIRQKASIQLYKWFPKEDRDMIFVDIVR